MVGGKGSKGRLSRIRTPAPNKLKTALKLSAVLVRYFNPVTANWCKCGSLHIDGIFEILHICVWNRVDSYVDHSTVGMDFTNYNTTKMSKKKCV